jgi:hypothetical protein
LVKWLSNYYTLTGAKKVIADYLNADYAKSAYSAGTEQTALTASDILLVSNGDDFHAKVAFANGVSIYKKGSTGTAAIADAESDKALTKVIESVPKIQYWKDGRSYFFAKITQLPNELNVPGVVRNHWYEMTVNNVYGLGTPVADEKTEVTPQKPYDEDWYISTSINVLAWKRSYQGVDLTTD